MITIGQIYNAIPVHEDATKPWARTPDGTDFAANRDGPIYRAARHLIDELLDAAKGNDSHESMGYATICLVAVINLQNALGMYMVNPDAHTPQILHAISEGYLQLQSAL